MALLAAGWFMWRRSREGWRHEGLTFLVFTVAIGLHVAAGAAADVFLGRLSAGRDPASELNATAAGLLVVQIVRCLPLLIAAYAWLVAVRPRLVRSWRGVVILIAFILAVFAPEGTLAFAILMAVPMLRLRWTQRVHGWGRFGLLIASGILTLALVATMTHTTSTEGFGELSASFGGGGRMTQISGELPGAAANLVLLVRPWEHALRGLLLLLHLQLLIAFLQLLVVPVRLRGLSLKRRFTVTLAMYRFIPGTLAFVFMVLIAYLGIGLHRARVVHTTMETTLDQSMRTVDALIAGGTRPTSNGAVLPPMVAGDRSFAMIRDLEWVAAGDTATGTDDTGDTASAADTTGVWAATLRAWSPDTPAAVLGRNAFAEIRADTSIGLTEAGGVLYLRAARVSRSGAKTMGVEVFAPVDSLYLTSIARRIQSDIRVDVSPRVFIGESSVQIVGGENSAWADSAFTIDLQLPRNASGDLWDRRMFLARNFLPTGNWLEAFGGSRLVGAVQLRLSTTPRRLFKSLTSNTLILTSQAFAILILIGIALLFFIVELSAVRTGRSIIQGILTDVKNLTLAARKFGEGDLSHRVDLAGHDEMGQLAATFNSMAANIEQHQAVLIEKERLEADLALARDIQQRMLPQSPPIIPGLDVAGLSIPSKEVGGDLFYFLPLSDGRLGLTIGDVSGKSVPAALLMSNVLAALKSEARIVDREDEILTHLNGMIAEQVETGRFVTFFYGVLDPAAQRLRYACAGHNPPLVVHADGEAEWLQEAGVPLGLMPDSTYSPAEASLRPGDVLVLYSDGVTEAQRDPSPAGLQGPGDEEEDTESEKRPTAFYDEHRLEAAVRESRSKSAAEIVAHVMESVRNFTEGAEQSDDLTLVVVRVV